MLTQNNKGVFFGKNLSKDIKEKFYYVSQDPLIGERLYFENSGGSLRLKKSVDIKKEYDKFPDNPGRDHNRSQSLRDAKEYAVENIKKVMLGTENGKVISGLTSSQIMFRLVGTILENTDGDNAVTTILEHPSAYDSVKYYCDKTNKEFRIVSANKTTGSIDATEILKKVDENTSLLNIIYASNISGTIMDLENIVNEVRKVNPDIYIVTDAVQHAPHGIIDAEKLKVDGVVFSPYKFFGPPGIGLAYISERTAKLPHHKIIDKPLSDWDLGAFSPADFASINEIINYVCWIGSQFIEDNNQRKLFLTGMDKIKLHERALLDRILNGTEDISGLRDISKVHIFMDENDLTKRDLIIAMNIDGLDPTKLMYEYRKYGIIVFARVSSDIFSKRIIDSLGLKGVVRVSPLHCHDSDDIDYFLKTTQRIAKETSK